MKKKQNGASTLKVQVFGRQGKLNVLTFLDVNFFSSVQKNRGTAFATVAYVLLQVIGSRRRVLSWTCRILWEKCCICFVLLNRSCLLLRSHVKHQKYSPLSLQENENKQYIDKCFRSQSLPLQVMMIQVEVAGRNFLRYLIWQC